MRARRARTIAIFLACLALIPGAAGAAVERRPDTRAGGSGILRQLAERPGAPVRFRRHGGKDEVIAAKAAFARALKDLREKDSRFDLRMLGDLTRSAIGAVTGAPLAGRPTAASDPAGAVHIVLAAGDMNGDGKADVFDYALDDEVSVIARRGDTGAELWRIPITGSDAIPIPMQDATGDDRDDVLMLELSEVDPAGYGDCAPLAVCFMASGQAFEWILSVRSGFDGKIAWTHTIPGLVTSQGTDASTDGAFLYTGALSALNGVIFSLPSADHNGDGNQDLVIDQLDIGNPAIYGAAYDDDTSMAALAAIFITATRATVVDGSTGATLFARASATAGLSFLLPAPDLTGDGTPDLLWDEDTYTSPVGVCSWPQPEPDGACVGQAVERRAADLIDGSTFQTVWSADLGGYGWVWPAGGDADGDGLDDLIFLGPTDDGPVSSLIKGTTGEVVWTSPDIALGVVSLPGGDPIVSTVLPVFSDTTYGHDQMRRRGVDGSLISSTHHEVDLPTDAFDLFIVADFWVVPDADDDGGADTLSQLTIDANEFAAHLWVERGSDGAEIFIRSGVGAPFAVPFADMDGDGNSDILDITATAHRHSFDLTLTGRSLLSGGQIWRRDQAVFRDAFVWLERSDDLTGQGGADLLSSWVQVPDGGVLESMIEGIEQSDGSTPWRLGADLSVPPPSATGGIGGTVTGGGAPFSGACVFANAVDGSESAVTLAKADGSYTVAELADGDYIVQFADCFFDAYAAEWWDDAAEFEDATPVSVVGGAVAAGVDADLMERS